MHRSKSLFLRVLVMVTGLALLLVACSGSVDDPPSANGGSAARDGEGDSSERTADVDGREGGTLRIGQTADISGFDPGQMPAPNHTVLYQVYDVLVLQDEEANPQPQLAERWEVPEDGTSIQLDLREGVAFHSGRDFTAADVVSSLEYYQDPGNGAAQFPLVEGVTAEVVDDHSVVMEFGAPNPGVFDLLDIFFILDTENIDDMAQHGIGTGPFTVDQWQPGVRTTLVRNEDYWGDRPLLEGIEIIVMPDAESQILQLEAGAIDYADRISLENFRRLQDDPSFETGQASPGNAQIFNINMNVGREPFGDKAVREAMDLALDRERMARDLVGEGAKAWCVPWAETSLAYSSELDQTCRFDLDAAQQKLDEAGFGDGFAFTLLTSSAIAQELDDIAQIYQSDLAQIGVEVTIQNVDLAQYRALRQETDFDAKVHAYGGAGKDPSYLLGATVVFPPETNQSNFESEEYADLVERAGSTLDEEERVSLLGQITDILVEEKFILPIAAGGRPWASQPSVHDITFTLDGRLLLVHAWLEE